MIIEKKFGPDKLLYEKQGFVVYLSPYLTNRTYIANNELSINEIKNLKFINFECGVLNKIKLNEGRETEIKSILDKYDIDWIVTWSDQSKSSLITLIL